MNLKRFFKNNRAVSPVIGVVLMVAITVILAAAIGSSVFGQGTSDPAPQANLKLTADSTVGTVIIEHLGGDPIKFTGNTTSTNVTAYDITSGNSSYPNATDLGIFDVGDTGSFNVSNVSSGNTVNIKIIDVATQQLICDQDVRF